MRHSFEAHDDPDLDSVWMWFEFQRELIDEEHGRVSRMFQPGNRVIAQFQQKPRFLGRTRAEVEDFFDGQSGQLELLTMFEILATTEAILRIDFKARVAARQTLAPEAWAEL